MVVAWAGLWEAVADTVVAWVVPVALALVVVLAVAPVAAAEVAAAEVAAVEVVVAGSRRQGVAIKKS
jgi:hypothetical protein